MLEQLIFIITIFYLVTIFYKKMSKIILKKIEASKSEKKIISEEMKKATKIGMLDYFLAFMPIPKAKEFITELVRQWRKKTVSSFVDWKFENWEKRYYKEYNKEFRSALKITHKNEEIRIPQILIFDNIEKNLKLSQITLKIRKDSFILDEKEKKLTDIFFNKWKKYLRKYAHCSNGKNCRLTNIKGTKFELQYVRYENYVRTNLILDARKKKEDKTLRERVHSNGRLEELSDSKLANNLGINFLLFTEDGFLVLQKRSTEVAFRCGEICPSSSGTVDDNDFIQTESTLGEMPILRETCEELGVDKDKKNYKKLVFLGITRELVRGGEPEMFFFAETKYSKEHFKKECRDARDKDEHKNIMFFNFGEIGREALITKEKKQKFLSKIDEFFDEYLKNSADGEAITLKANLVLWIRYRLKEQKQNKV